MAVGALPGWGIQRGAPPTPVAAVRRPTWEEAGQSAVAAWASGQSGTPASFASSPWGRWTERLWGLASPSWRVRVMVKGLKEPARLLRVPAWSCGENPPLLQPLVICIGASPVTAGLPDQGVNA